MLGMMMINFDLYWLQKKVYPSTCGDTFILHNTGGKQIDRTECISELRRYKTKCSQCKAIIQRVRSLLDEIKAIKNTNTVGVCEHCKRASLTKTTCKRCEFIVTKFLSHHYKICEVKQERFKIWLSKVKHLLQAIVDGDSVCQHRVYKDPELERILKELKEPVSMRQPDIDFYPSLDQKDMILWSMNRNKEILEELLSKIRLEREGLYQSDLELPKDIELGEQPFSDLSRLLSQEVYKNLITRLLNLSQALPRGSFQDTIETLNTAIYGGLTTDVIKKLVLQLETLNKSYDSQVLDKEVVQRLTDDLNNLMTLGTSKSLDKNLVQLLVDLSNGLTHEISKILVKESTKSEDSESHEGITTEIPEVLSKRLFWEEPVISRETSQESPDTQDYLSDKSRHDALHQLSDHGTVKLSTSLKQRREISHKGLVSDLKFKDIKLITDDVGVPGRSTVVDKETSPLLRKDKSNSLLQKLDHINKALGGAFLDKNIIEDLSTDIKRTVSQISPDLIKSMVTELVDLCKPVVRRKSKNVNVNVIQGLITDASLALDRGLSKDQLKEIIHGLLSDLNKELHLNFEEQKGLKEPKDRILGSPKRLNKEDLSSSLKQRREISLKGLVPDLKLKDIKLIKNDVGVQGRSTVVDKETLPLLPKDKTNSLLQKLDHLNKALGGAFLDKNVIEDLSTDIKRTLSQISPDLIKSIVTELVDLCKPVVRGIPKNVNVKVIQGLITDASLALDRGLSKDLQKKTVHGLLSDLNKELHLKFEEQIGLKERIPKTKGQRKDSNLIKDSGKADENKQKSVSKKESSEIVKGKKAKRDSKDLSEKETLANLKKIKDTPQNANIEDSKKNRIELEKGRKEDVREVTEKRKKEGEKKITDTPEKGKEDLKKKKDESEIRKKDDSKNNKDELETERNDAFLKLKDELQKQKKEAARQAAKKATPIGRSASDENVIKSKKTTDPKKQGNRLSKSEANIRAEDLADVGGKKSKMVKKKEKGGKEDSPPDEKEDTKNTKSKLKLNTTEDKISTPKQLPGDALANLIKDNQSKAQKYQAHKSKMLAKQKEMEKKRLKELSLKALRKQSEKAKTKKKQSKSPDELSDTTIEECQIQEMGDGVQKIIIMGEQVTEFDPRIIMGSVVQERKPLLFKRHYKFKDTVIPDKKKELGYEAMFNDGVLRYKLSDKEFIEKGWTQLPTKKIMRRMNIYRMVPVNPQNCWFERHKKDRHLSYDGGPKLADIDDKGHGRLYYRNGSVALEYYNAQESNIGQRYVIYSSGEKLECGKIAPRTILALFDDLGNGVVYDHCGNIRLKYNQSEGLIVDPKLGPPGKWKWHALNDPPVLQQVFINTRLRERDPRLELLPTPEKAEDANTMSRETHADMLAIELENFAKEKENKMMQKYKPFQIRMKAVKINEQFSLKILDQSNINLIFRDGSTNLKLSMGLILMSNEIIDTEITDMADVVTPYDKYPAKSLSVENFQKILKTVKRRNLRQLSAKIAA